MATDVENGTRELRSADVQVVVPRELHLHISFEGMPEPALAALKKMAETRSESKLKNFVKDYVPALTPIATALFTGLVAFYGIKFNDQLTRDTLDKITTDFVEKKEDPNIAAMKLAAYGDKALPAVWIALGGDDTLRDGAVKIAEQMVYQKAVDQSKMTAEMLDRYQDNPALRLGVLEWLAAMESEDKLSAKQVNAALALLQKTFGVHGERCEAMGEDLADAAADFLSAGSFPQAKDFVDGMDQKCPKDYAGVHKTLQDIKGPK